MDGRMIGRSMGGWVGRNYMTLYVIQDLFCLFVPSFLLILQGAPGLVKELAYLCENRTTSNT